MHAMNIPVSVPVRAAPRIGWPVALRRPAQLGVLALLATSLSGCVVAPPLRPPPPPPRPVVVAPPSPVQPAPPVLASTQPPEAIGARAPMHSPDGPPGQAGVPMASGQPGALGPMYFYPERNQPEAQQDRDRFECYRWAVRETGTDPGMTTVRQPVVVTSQPIQPLRDGSAVLHGATQGAVLGAVVSSPRQAGANAVIGAIFGAVMGAAAQESRAQYIEQQQYRQQQQAAAMAHAANAAARAPTDNFRRAMSACMGGRGYRIG
jgi:hypothetical protein